MNCKFVSSFFLKNCNESYDRKLPAQPWSSQYEVNIFYEINNVRLSQHQTHTQSGPVKDSSSVLERFFKDVMIRPVWVWTDEVGMNTFI